MRKRFDWNEEKEKLVLELKDAGWTYKEIAEKLGHTTSSIKHKYTRLKQRQNSEEVHHPEEKTEQVLPFLRKDMSILETHAGFGNLSKVYNKYASKHILFEKKGERVEKLKSLNLSNVEIIKCDCEREIHRLVYERQKFDFIDIDPYGYPSRLFPHVLELIDDGFLVVTIPKYGVQMVNKVMAEHLRTFWGFTKGDDYKEVIVGRLKDFGFQAKRGVEVENVVDLGRLYRFLLRVKKQSTFDLVGLEINY